mmetsp:Transcript_87072/g.144818  ORF Transcript_87072/g.144818 Transcript_87072/m.144818 type:complete len:233 (+) Transcript_87072:1961-2659(+)
MRRVRFRGVPGALRIALEVGPKRLHAVQLRAGLVLPMKLGGKLVVVITWQLVPGFGPHEQLVVERNIPVAFPLRVVLLEQRSFVVQAGDVVPHFGRGLIPPQMRGDVGHKVVEALVVIQPPLPCEDHVLLRHVQIGKVVEHPRASDAQLRGSALPSVRLVSKRTGAHAIGKLCLPAQQMLADHRGDVNGQLPEHGIRNAEHHSTDNEAHSIQTPGRWNCQYRRCKVFHNALH